MSKLTKHSLLRGIGSVVDIWPSGRHRSAETILKRSSAEAIRNDWVKVGKAISAGIKREHHGQITKQNQAAKQAS